MVKYIFKYAEEKNPSIYIEKIMNDIIVRLKKDKSYDDVIFLPIEWSLELLIK